jgi:heterodisulfide reductase subunit A
VAERVGVYICECGPNISEAIDVNALVTFAQGLENVVLAKAVEFLCSAEGRTRISEEIKEQKLTRVVFAACSPKEHEITFREMLTDAGLNPFLMQTANIREQCAYVIKDKSLATDKARMMINAAVSRVMHHEVLEVSEIALQPDVLVLGAGIAGISAALTLAQKDRKVYLLEKLPSIGGKVALYEYVFPTLQCASCVLDQVSDEVLHHERIEVLTHSAVQEVLGFYGNFVVKVSKKARCVEASTCIGCEACLQVCPVEVSNEYNEGLDKRHAIFIPYPGALPNLPVIDKESCLRWQGENCTACQEACPFGCINYEEADQVEELKVGAIVVATGFDIFDPRRAPQYGYGKVENVYTSLELERLCNSTGPTGGEIVLKNGRPPERIALVHCVGSRSSEFNDHCSGVCCTYLLKLAHQVKKKLPDVTIAELYSDFCLPGKEAQRFFEDVSGENGLELFHMKASGSVEISQENGRILIKYADVDGGSRTVTSDMVVLAPAIEGAKDAADLAEILDISRDGSGFFAEENPNLAPVSSGRDGIFVVGCARGPKDIQASVADGQAAAGKILSSLIPGEKLVIGAITAEADSDLCSGCKICISVCPYRAIAYDDIEKHAAVNQILCKGCGICAAACPSGAITAHYYTDSEISAEIKGLLGAS